MKRLLALLLLPLLLAACDSGLTGDPAGNRPPETALSVRDSSLVGDVDDDDRLTSTVFVSWSGTDPDGLVVAYDVRYYDEAETRGPEEGWTRTTRRDSLLLLPIPPGADRANVVVEVRAVDEEGAVDPEPARTVFPIINSPPTLRLVPGVFPPDETWPLFSFAWTAADPEGPTNLLAVEVALNDTTGWVRLPPDVDFATFVAADPRATGTVDAVVYLGRAFQTSAIRVPGLRMDADNVFYIRAVDQTEAASAPARYPADDAEAFLVRRVTSDVLLVNDYRGPANTVVMPFHREVLARYGGAGFDEWDLSATPQTANNPLTSEALPSPAEPTLRQTLALWDRIYWVSNAATNRTAGNNLPLAAGVMDLFFERGGRLFVQVPVSLPLSGDPAENLGNEALNILPLDDLITLPAGITALRIRNNATIRPDRPLPGTAEPLPPLRSTQIVIGALPYIAGPDDVVLYRATFYDPANPTQDWPGSDVVASISDDSRVGLFALPPVNTGTGVLLFAPAEAGGPDLYDAIGRMLAALSFPR